MSNEKVDEVLINSLKEFLKNIYGNNLEFYEKPFLNGAELDLAVIKPDLGVFLWKIIYDDIQKNKYIVKLMHEYKKNLVRIIPELGEKTDKEKKPLVL